MEDYGWLIFVAIFWVLSTIGEFRKKGKARRRDGVDAPERRGSRPDPAASGRELAGDVDAGARQAEEALLRWEARQRKATVARRQAEGGRRETARRRADEEDRRAAYEAIAGMLSPQTEIAPQAETAAETEGSASWKAGALRELEIVDEVARSRAAVRKRLHSPSSAVRPARAGGLARLDALPLMQRAIVLRELLGPPKALD